MTYPPILGALVTAILVLTFSIIALRSKCARRAFNYEILAFGIGYAAIILNCLFGIPQMVAVYLDFGLELPFISRTVASLGQLDFYSGSILLYLSAGLFGASLGTLYLFHQKESMKTAAKILTFVLMIIYTKINLYIAFALYAPMFNLMNSLE